MIKGEFLIGEPVDFKGICKVYSPKINQVLTSKDYLNYFNILTMEQEQLNKEYENEVHIPTPLEVLLVNMHGNEVAYQRIVEAFEFFIHEPILPLYNHKAFLIGDPEKVLNSEEEPRLLDETNFFEFQNLVRATLAVPPLDKEEIQPDMDPRLRKMKERKKQAQKVKAKQQQKNGEVSTTEQNLVAIFLMGIGLTPLNIGELTYAAMTYIIKGYQEKESYDSQMRIMTSGFGSKKLKTPKYWMTQI